MTNRWNDNDPDDECTPPVPRRNRITAKVGKYAVAGVVSNGHSIRGRKMPVYAVQMPHNLNQLMALKLSWRGARHIDIVNNIEEKIRDSLRGRDIGVTTSERPGCPEPDNVLQQIRGKFTGDSEQITHRPRRTAAQCGSSRTEAARQVFPEAPPLAINGSQTKVFCTVVSVKITSSSPVVPGNGNEGTSPTSTMPSVIKRRMTLLRDLPYQSS
ncbi:hypothetical protein BJ138DRAFT_1118419 [Hygrophoropsis aurantiaca]|uniref:Uncharacterized protein n=1 Tax=Hygrophoropsis aurantiaca TaxID=72124 RepID=A0ACB7ZX13_9AGAM|nr:hypothetical protein BJ138DRAFT_1118419 [Hygrophoropsis aurantiaca]